MALEATAVPDLAPLVIYVADGATFQHSHVFNELIQPDDVQSAILVIGECLPKDRASIWNLLRAKSNRLRLVTIDHGPEDAGGGGMCVIQVPATDRTTLAKIISDYGMQHAGHRSAKAVLVPRRHGASSSRPLRIQPSQHSALPPNC